MRKGSEDSSLLFEGSKGCPHRAGQGSCLPSPTQPTASAQHWATSMPAASLSLPSRPSSPL